MKGVLGNYINNIQVSIPILYHECISFSFSKTSFLSLVHFPIPIPIIDCEMTFHIGLGKQRKSRKENQFGGPFLMAISRVKNLTEGVSNPDHYIII